MGHADLNLPQEVKDKRAAIAAFEKAVGEMPQLEQQLTHYFCKGIYARELFIPKGAYIVGKIHKDECLNVVLTGKIAVATETGDRIVEAPAVFVSGPGTKRAAVALEDTIWMNVHPNPENEKDLELLEAQYIVKTHEELEGPQVEMIEDKT